MQQPVSIPLPSPWQMEAIKRRLDAVPARLGHARRVALLGHPAVTDLPGQFRLAGAEALLAAHGMLAVAGLRAEAAIWLAPRLPATPPLGLPETLLHWPAPDAADAGLPDPAHALFGLLEQHQPGEDVLVLPEHDWSTLLPASRLQPLRLAPPGGALARLARRRLLEATRRLLVRHAALRGATIGGSILAALLGRRFLAAPEHAAPIADYWARLA